MMIANPRVLVQFVGHIPGPAGADANTPDAIFVPFTRRHAYINELLEELSWYKGPVYLMPSTASDMNGVVVPKDMSVHTLYVSDEGFHSLYERLLTSNNRLLGSRMSKWDLPEKRTYALWYAQRNAYRAILLVDDDMRGICPSLISSGMNCLDQYNVAGCYVDTFCDTSVLGHLEVAAGRPVYPFLSGSFLLLKVATVTAFFSRVYNEDWLFMLPQIARRSVVAFGSISQVEYAPFELPQRASDQEFGDLLAEGLYALFQSGQYNLRTSTCVWRKALEYRRTLMEELQLVLTEDKYARCLAAALATNSQITPDDCVSFVQDWEQDCLSWETFLRETA